MNTPRHIEVRRHAGGVVVAADDYELFDFLQDHLLELGLDCDYQSEESCDGRRHFRMHFPANITFEELENAVNQIPASEIERIWNINNGP